MQWLQSHSHEVHIVAAMLYKQTLFIIAASLTAVVRGLPSPSPSPAPEELKVIGQYEVEGGNITWYGDSDTPAKRSFDTVDLNRRCGTNAVTCSGSHKASSTVCGGLGFALSGPQNSGTVIRNPRSVCYKASGQSSGECCVSWANPVSNAVDGDFTNAVITINNRCVDGSRQVSGLMRDTTIGSTCTTVCLSNRPDGCR
jgi:hypothetical protein